MNVKPPRYETREVLADAYPPRVIAAGGPFLTHTAAITDAKPDGFPLCNRVKEEHLADPCANPLGLQKPPTCRTCRSRDPRFRDFPGIEDGFAFWTPGALCGICTEPVEASTALRRRVDTSGGFELIHAACLTKHDD